MHSRSRYRALIGLNLVLLGALALVTLSPGAGAQPQNASNRGRGTYTMIPGRIQGSSSGALWVIDDTNQEMVTLRYNQGQRSMNFIGYRDLAADSGATARKGR